jgi:hypothetical protein
VRYVELACRVLIGFVFAVSATSKVSRRVGFASFVESVRWLLPRAGTAAPLVATATIAAELAIPVALLPAATARWAFGAATATLLAFTGALAAAIHRGVTTPCRCFGASSTPPGRSQLIRNAALICAAVAGAIASRGSANGLGVEPAGAAVAIGAGAIGAALAVAADDIAILFQSPRSRSQS